MIKTILFDLDGVLVDACHWHYLSLNCALKDEANITIDYDDHLNIFNGLPTFKKLQMLQEENKIQGNQIKKIQTLKQKYTIDMITNQSKIDTIKIYLHNKLKNKGISIGCVTNSIKETAELMLSKTGQLEFINLLVTNEDVKNNKPHPEPYIFAMTKMQSLPSNTLIIEDSDKGYQSALASGAHVLKVNTVNDVTWLNISNKIKKINI